MEGAELYEKITDDLLIFEQHSPKMTGLFKKITLGTATYEDVYDYSTRLGEYTAEVFQKYLTESNLPNGKLDFETSKQTIGRVLRDNYYRVNGYGCQVQENLNQDAGMGLNALPGEYNADRVNDLAANISNCNELDRARELMEAPVVNTTQSYADALVKANADFHYECGLVPIIRRQAQPGCCPWCAALAGDHEYPVEDEDIYHRHERCKCVVTYLPAEGKHKGQMQDVWSKKWYAENREALKTFNL